MRTLKFENIPTTAGLYSTWLILLYFSVGYAILSGEMLYRMEQVVDYTGSFSSPLNRDKAALAFMVVALFSQLCTLWFGAILIRLKTSKRRWIKWPLTGFCLCLGYTVLHNTIRLSELYYNLIGPLDWIFAYATVFIMISMIFVLHLTDYYSTFAVNSAATRPIKIRA